MTRYDLLRLFPLLGCFGAHLSGDLFGQWVLVRPAAGDSAWVVDVGRGGFIGTVDGAARLRRPAHGDGAPAKVPG